MVESPETVDSNENYRLNQMFETLKHPFRRQILFRLNEHAPRSEAELTADHLDTDGDEPDVLTLQLRHRHFPKLASAGYIDWDESTDTVHRGPKFDEVEPLLRLMRDHQDEFPGIGQ